MGKPKGLPKSGGRQRGTPNKTTSALKDMILQALDEAGGVDYLVAQAAECPTAFLSLVGRVLPLSVAGPTGGAILFSWADSAADAIVDPSRPRG